MSLRSSSFPKGDLIMIVEAIAILVLVSGCFIAGACFGSKIDINRMTEEFRNGYDLAVSQIRDHGVWYEKDGQKHIVTEYEDVVEYSKEDLKYFIEDSFK